MACGLHPLITLIFRNPYVAGRAAHDQAVAAGIDLEAVPVDEIPGLAVRQSAAQHVERFAGSRVRVTTSRPSTGMRF